MWKVMMISRANSSKTNKNYKNPQIILIWGFFIWCNEKKYYLCQKYKNMEIVLGLVLLVVFLFIVFIFDISGISVCGSPKSDELYLELIRKMKERKIEYVGETGGSGFITTVSTDLPYISRSIKGILFGYYIGGYGIVPRWYKSHKEITKIFNQFDNK